MSNNKYIVKSLAPWMIDELLAFSKLAVFDLVLLRKQDDFYDESLKLLEENGVTVLIEPFSYNFALKKSLIICLFTFKNIFSFGFDYNSVSGFKSIFWFLKLDLRYFSEESNIHAQFGTQSSIVSLLVKMFYSNKPLMSFTFHAYDIYGNNKWFNVLVSNCYRAFSISNFNIDYVKNKYKSPDASKIKLSRLGVFRDDIAKTDKIDSDKFTLGLISWFIEKKGIINLLNAMKILKEKGFDTIKLKLAGDGPLKKEFMDFIEEHNLDATIEYIGKIKGDEKNSFFNSLDAFVLPSIKLKNDQDGIPVVLMEAIAYSLPIISTNISGIPEICRNDYNGHLIEEGNVTQIVDSILHLFNNVEDRERYAKNSFMLSEEYDIVSNSKSKVESLGWI